MEEDANLMSRAHGRLCAFVPVGQACPSVMHGPRWFPWRAIFLHIIGRIIGILHIFGRIIGIIGGDSLYFLILFLQQ